MLRAGLLRGQDSLCRLFLRFFAVVYLTVQRLSRGFPPQVCTVTLLNSCLNIIGHHRKEIFGNFRNNHWVFYRCCYLNTALGISRHKICGGNINPLALGSAEDINSAVFQEPAHNGNHGNIVGFALNSADKTAGSPYQQLYFHTAFPRLNKPVHNILIGKGV